MAKSSLLVVLALTPWLRAGVAAAAQEDQADDSRVVEICSDDAPETWVLFLRATAQALSESKIRLRFACRRDPPADAQAAEASFVADEGVVSLRLLSATHGQNAHRLAWLDDVHRPLARTIALGKATTLGLLLDSLAADLQTLRLRPLPVLPPTEPPVPVSPASPTGENVERPAGPPISVVTGPAVLSPIAQPSVPSVAQPVVRVAALPAPPPALAKESAPAASPSERTPAEQPAAKKADGAAAKPKPAVSQPPAGVAEISSVAHGQAGRRSLEITLPVAGIDWMPPSTVAPQLEAGVAWGGPRWWMLAQGILQLDSNFAMDWRTFHTAGYGLRIGARRTLLRSERFRWDAEAGLVGHVSQYRRDGIANAETHAWMDLGAGLHSRAVLRVARHVSALVSVGGQVFPTARTATIPNGPSRTINLFTVSAVAGLCVDF